MEWIGLLLVAILLIISCVLGYSDAFRGSQFYYPICFTIGTVLNAVWYWVVQYIGSDKHRLYVYSVIWDAVIVAVFYLIPLFFCDVHLSKWGILGLALIIGGLALIKFGG